MNSFYIRCQFNFIASQFPYYSPSKHECQYFFIIIIIIFFSQLCQAGPRRRFTTATSSRALDWCRLASLVTRRRALTSSARTCSCSGDSSSTTTWTTHSHPFPRRLLRMASNARGILTRSIKMNIAVYLIGI